MLSFNKNVLTYFSNQNRKNCQIVTLLIGQIGPKLQTLHIPVGENLPYIFNKSLQIKVSIVFFKNFPY